MSLYVLAGLDLPNLVVLSQQLAKYAAPMQPTPCSLCKKTKREQLMILINYDLAEDNCADLVLVCGRCRQEHKGQPTVNIKYLITVLNTVIGYEFCKEAMPAINLLIENVKLGRAIKRYSPNQLIKQIRLKLLSQEEGQDTAECEDKRRTCQLILQFYTDLRKSHISGFYRSLFGEEVRIEPTLINFLRIFCGRQRAFKLDILQRMVQLTKQTKDIRDLFKWVRKGMKGLGEFSCAFAASPRNLENILFSVCRHSIQFRYIFSQQQLQCECELLVAQFPFNQRPTLFRITSSGFEDQVQVGLFFAKRNLADGLQVGCAPVLYRFTVGFFRVDKRGSSVEANRHRLDKDSKSYSASKIIDEPQAKGRKRRPVFGIKDEDELQLRMDYSSEKLRISNRTQNKQLLEVSIKAGHTAKYFIFPCVRLIGTRITVDSLKQ